MVNFHLRVKQGEGNRFMSITSEWLNIISKAQMGNHQAQTQLLEAWYPRVYQFCLASLMDHDTAMEASQKTFIRVWKKLGTLKDGEKFKSWLFSIAHNQCLEERRTETRHLNGKNGFVTHGSSGFHYSITNPEDVLIQKELRNTLNRAIQELPAEQRQVVMLKEMEGLKFREIAEVLCISENTAKSRLYYAFKNLRISLTKRNINQNSFGDER